MLPDILAPRSVAVEDDIKPVLRPQRQYPGKRKQLSVGINFHQLHIIPIGTLKLLSAPTIKQKNFIKSEDSSDSQVPQFDSVEVDCMVEDMQNWEDNFHSDLEVSA